MAIRPSGLFLSIMGQPFTFCKATFFLSFLLLFALFEEVAAQSYGAQRLGVSLETLQRALEKVERPITFVPRLGSTQGTQEAKLPSNAGIVQIGGDPGNLVTAVLWLPVDATGNLAGPKAKDYLTTFVRTFTAEGDGAVTWVEQVTRRAVAEAGKETHLESQLFGEHLLKATYLPTLSSPMVAVAITRSEGEF